MTESNTGGLVHEGHMPLAWREFDAPPDAPKLTRAEAANLRVVHTLLMLETQLGESSDGTEEVAREALARVDFKLNLLLELVGELFAQHQLIPPARAVSLNAAWVRWRDTTAPTVGRWLRLELYASHHYPRPLILHGSVSDIAPAEEGTWSIHLTLQGLGETVQEELERFIFVQHRRALAHSRRR